MWVLASTVTCIAATAPVSELDPCATSGKAWSLPSNIAAAPVFAPLLERMWHRSPTFRRQWARVALARSLTVRLLLEETPRHASFSARTVFRYRDGRVVTADVYLPPSPDAPGLIGHEVEHVLEQLDRVDLVAHVSAGSVWRREDGAFESHRAIDAGLRVAREMEACGR